METSPVAAPFLCTQCGGELHPDEGQIFITCPYCSSTVYVDKAQVVFHWYLASTLDDGKARASLARWMAGNQTVKDLDKKARLVGQVFEYFPLWLFKRRGPGGKEEILIEPAAATSVSEIRRLRLPAGDLRKYEPALDSQAHPPSVPLGTALKWMEDRQIPSKDLIERSLVHIPLYTFKYEFGGRPYTALVEAGTGEVFANLYPAKAEAPYLLAGGVTAAVFLCLALAPVIGVLARGGEGLGIGLAACASLGLLAAPFLFAFAAWVAAKI
jgi:DNA-directed RNA polymerase subunit RPC12/RpoP